MVKYIALGFHERKDGSENIRVHGAFDTKDNAIKACIQNNCFKKGYYNIVSVFDNISMDSPGFEVNCKI